MVYGASQWRREEKLRMQADFLPFATISAVYSFFGDGHTIFLAE
jgi:hypothetical protein